MTRFPRGKRVKAERANAGGGPLGIAGPARERAVGGAGNAFRGANPALVIVGPAREAGCFRGPQCIYNLYMIVMDYSHSFRSATMK